MNNLEKLLKIQEIARDDERSKRIYQTVLA